MIVHRDLDWDEIGQSYLKGDLAGYFAHLETTFLQLALDRGFCQVFPGSLLSAKLLGNLDYLHSFPQHATFPCCLEHSDANLEQFRSATIVVDDYIQLTKTAPVQAMLLPAACYTVYPQIQSCAADAPEQLVTVQAKCFRREAKYAPLERQWNFTMRELVCIGSSSQVQQFLDTWQQQIAEICDQLQLPVRLELATDPFFNPENNPQYIMQKVAPSKREVVFGGDLAIASLNFHRQYFGETFNLKRGDEFCHTGCVAFGVERWLAAMLRQHDGDIEHWPRLKAIGGEGC